MPDADRRILGVKDCGTGNNQYGGYGGAPEKQLGNQEGLPQPDWDEWFSERSLRASPDGVKRGTGREK